ncbi:MAG TPA: helix-turn-helix transcriptional regulator [Streptosporangiaceae bacterium]|jgi:transcriptional regulator with XRE-family HTH domain|nr:helix-turn-helix transcriptional regulator [Streptosporangiaceae bacterium]
MAEETTGSTVPRRQLGRHLRDLRNSQRLTVRAAAVKLEWSEAKIWRIETGQTSLRSLDVEAMCRIYGAAPALTEALMGLAKETKARGWWHAFGDVIPEGFDVYIGLEEAAESISWYESELVPGLLQTESYARAVIAADNPGVDDEEISRRVHVRIERQSLVTRVTNAPELRIALNEAIVRRPVGGAGVMSGQFRRLLDASELPNVALRVLPFSAGLHPGVMSGPFEILRFPLNGDGKPSEPPTVYADGFTGALYLDKPKEIERYDEAFAGIWSVSLSEQASRDLLSQTTKEIG